MLARYPRGSHMVHFDLSLLCSQIWPRHSPYILIFSCFSCCVHKSDFHLKKGIVILFCCAHKFDFRHNPCALISACCAHKFHLHHKKKQYDFWLLCSQIWLRPKPLHVDLLLLCSQIWLLPQSLHCDLLLLCLQIWVRCLDLLQMSKHFTHCFVNCPPCKLNK